MKSLLYNKKIRRKYKNAKKKYNRIKITEFSLNEILIKIIIIIFLLVYNHIYFFDNNEPGDESINDLEIVKDGIKEGFITVIDYSAKNIQRKDQMEI